MLLKKDAMKIAVLGTGTVGRTVAGALAGLGHEAVVGTRDPEATLARTAPDAMGAVPFGEWLVDNPDVPLVAYREAAAGADLVVNATLSLIHI